MALNQFDDTMDQLGPQPTIPKAPQSANPFADTLGADQAKTSSTAPAQPQQPATNPFHETLQMEDAAQATKVKQGILHPDAPAAGRAADVLKYATAMHLPPDVVDRNFDEISSRWKLQQTPIETLQKDAPATADYMAQGPHQAALASADLPQLTAIEKLLRAGSSTVRSLGAGVMGFSRGVWGLVQAGAELEGGQLVVPTSFGMFTVGADFAKGSQETAATLQEAARGKYLATPESQGGPGLVERAVYGGVEGLGVMAPSMLAGALIGPGALIGSMAAVSGGEAYGVGRGQGLKPDEAASYSTIQATIAGATAMVPGRWFIKDLTENPAFSKMLMHQVVSMVPAMEAQTALADLTAWYALPANTDKPFAEYLKERPSAAAASLIGAIVMGSTTAVGTKMTATMLADVGAKAKDSATFKSAPDQLAQIIDGATRGMTTETVYLPVKDFTEYYQDAGIDPREFAAKVTGSAAAYDRALATGEDLAVPMSKYITEIAATDHNEAVSQMARLHPDEMNAREADAFREAQKQATEPKLTSAEELRTTVADQLHQAGFERSTAETYAKLYEQAFGTLADRAGLDPLELYKRYGLNINRAALEAPAGKREGTAAPAAPFPEGPSIESRDLPLPPAPVEKSGLADIRRELVKLGLVSATDPAGGATGGSAESLDAPVDSGPKVRPLPEVPAPSTESAIEGLRTGLIEHGLLPGEGFAKHIEGMKRRQADWVKSISDTFGADGIVRTVNEKAGVEHVIHESTQEPGKFQVTTFRDGVPEGHFNVDSVEAAAKELIGEKLAARATMPGDGEAGTQAASSNGRGAEPTDRAGNGLQDSGREPVAGSEGGAVVPGGERQGAGGGRTVPIPNSYVAHFDRLAVDARSNGFTGSDDTLAEIFNARLAEARDIVRQLEPDDIQVNEHNDLLRFIADAGGLGIEAEGEGGMRGELEHMLENLSRANKSKAVIRRGKRAGTEQAIPKEFRRSGGLKGIPGIVKRSGGRTADNIFEALNEDGRFGEINSLADMLAKIDDAIRIETGMSAAPEVGGFDVAGVLDGALKVREGEKWWGSVDMLGEAPGDVAAEFGAEGLGDEATSFDIRQFDQGGLFDPPETPGPVVDLLSTGEEQPRLPGDVGAVRDTEVKQQPVAELRDEFRLTAPEETQAKQTSLFQGSAPSKEFLDARATFEASEAKYDEAVKAYKVLPARAKRTGGPAAEQLDAALQEHLAARDVWEAAQRAEDKRVAAEQKAAAPKAPKQTTLFQRGKRLTQADVDEFVKLVNVTAGPDLQMFMLHAEGNGDLKLDGISVARGAARAGLGTAVMQELTRYADANDARISLNLAPKGYQPVEGGATTSSTDRLRSFYKRFGFVDAPGGGDVWEKALNELRMMREPTLDARTLGQPKPGADLLVQHNLTAENLRHAEKMGGLPVPSLAITKVDDALTNFGEITLLGPKEMADPRSAFRPKVFAADAYATRYPTVHFKIDAAGEKVLRDTLAPYSDLTDTKYFDLDTVQKEGARGLRQDARVMAAFLDSEGITVEKSTEADDYYRRQATRSKLSAAIESHNLDRAFETYTDALLKKMNPTEKIYKGFTNQGNPSYQPHTLENVVRIIKREMRGGESQSNIYGPGQLRAKFTEQFKSVKEIRAAKDRIISDAEFDRVKEDVNDGLFEIADALKPSYEHGDANRFGFSDTVMAVMEDTPKLGLDKALAEYGFKDVDAETKQAIRDYIRKLATLPTEYFEGKIPRAVDVGEFKAAVVPENAPADVVALLKSKGLHVETYKTNEMRKLRIAEVAKAIGEDVLFQPGARRGAIRFGPDRQFSIDLLERADLSTFLHETGHFYLEVFGDVVKGLRAKDPAGLNDTQRTLIKDYETTLGHIGGIEGLAIPTEAHELFAREFEGYLMEGEAPSDELRSTFARFRAWLLGVYQSVKNLGVNLTPEVRAVFDRMLATDAAISDAQKRGAVEPMFATAADAGMSEREFKLYSDTVADASRTAREQLQTKLMSEVQRERQAQWRAEREKVRKQLTAEAYALPEYQAMAAIRRGQNPDGTPLVDGLETEPLKLSKQILIERYGEDRLARLPKPALYTVEGGLDPDLVAAKFGYSSGDEMLTAIENAPPVKQLVDQATQKHMIAEHGSILLDGSLHEKAEQAVANTKREAVIKSELRALAAKRRQVAPFIEAAGTQARATAEAERAYERRWLEAEAKLRIAMAEGHKQVEIDALTKDVAALKAKARGGAATINRAIPPDAVLKQIAEERIGSTVIHNLRPEVFWSASRRASRDATDAAARQDLEGAITAKQQELLNVHLFRAATDAREDVDARVREAKDLGSKPAVRARIGKAGDSFLAQIDGILERYSFTPMSRKQTGERASLLKWVEAMKGMDRPLDLPDEVLNEAQRIPFTELTYEQLLGISDGLRQIKHLAYEKGRLLQKNAKASLDETAAGMVRSIRENYTGTPVEVSRDRSTGEKGRVITAAVASMVRLNDFLRELDGGKDGGAMQSAITFRLNEAGADEIAREAKATTAVAEIVEKAYPRSAKQQLYVKEWIPSIGKSLSKMERLMYALNSGNKEGLQRITSYEKWSPVQLRSVLDTLDARDMQMVQAILDHVNSYKQDIVDKYKRVYGIEPKMVDAVPIRTKHGEIPGGYFPLKYDDRQSANISNKELTSGAFSNLAAYTTATTARGFLKERVQNVKEPIRLDFGVLFGHLRQVIHDLSHHEALIDVGRLLGHRDVQQAIIEAQGDIAYKEIKRTIRDVALGIAPDANGFETALGYARSGAVIGMLGWKVSTPMLHLSGALPKIFRQIGPKWAALGVARWARGPETMESTSAWVNANSATMANRHRTWERSLNEVRARMGVDSGKLSGWVAEALHATTFGLVDKQQIADGYFSLVGRAQKVADYVTFLGNYEKARAGGESHTRAVAIAEQGVLDAFGGGQVKDLPAVMRGNAYLKTWTTFYGPFNSTFNLFRSSVRRTRFSSPVSVGRLGVDFLTVVSLPALLGFGIRQALKPKAQDGSEDDAKALAAELVAAHASYMADMMVGTRELSGSIEGYNGYEGPAGAGVFNTFGQTVHAGRTTIGKVVDGQPEEAFGPEFWRTLNESAGIVFQYPAPAVWNLIRGMQAMSEGKTDDPRALITRQK